ncbi:hypothetical protein LJB83_00020 [Clostridia bacterium OttesenSCG-928-F22]|nr:hypothetical protein [Clostridia bacterium OttesenSCG-928-F22]
MADNKKRVTLEDIESIAKEILTPADIAPYLGCDQYSINVQAQNDPAKLGFPVVVHGSRVKIPKQGFVYFMRYGYASPVNQEAL